MRIYQPLVFILLFILQINLSSAQIKPIRIAVAGMTHGHVGWILNASGTMHDFELVGFSESNEDLANRLIDQYELDPGLWYNNIDEMLQEVKPEAVCAFGSIFEHLMVVEKCAPLGIHVMVEKPLAVNLEHANNMKQLAERYGIYLLTNYETTWYPSNHKINEMQEAGIIGGIRKIVIHDGHQGPIEIGCSTEFLAWLTDPIMNGGGAIIDFGCYGANLATWIMNDQKPISVTAVTQQFKPKMYPNVDDEATIILGYPQTQAIIQASWNWPYSRKDIEVYGEKGYLFGPNGHTLVSKLGDDNEKSRQLALLPAPENNPFSYFVSVINGTTDPSESLSSLQNNMIVVEILSAAVQSAREGKTIFLR